MMETNAAGATRILVGLILVLGTIAEVLFHDAVYTLIDFLMFFVMFIIGFGFIHWGYLANHSNSDIC